MKANVAIQVLRRGALPVLVSGCAMSLMSGCTSAHRWDTDAAAYSPNTGYPIMGRDEGGLGATVQLPGNPVTSAPWPSVGSDALQYNPYTGYPYLDRGW
jgi:hypothetical protein